MMKAVNPHQKRDKGHVPIKRQQMLKKKNKYGSKKELAFRNGGSFEDPLNLKSISVQSHSAENSPAASPSSHSARAQRADLIPVIKVQPGDPLNLEEGVPENEHKQRIKDQFAKVNSSLSKKPRHHRSRKNDGHDSAPEDGHEVEGGRPRSLSLGARSTADHVVSPVTATPSPRKRTRTVSEGTSCSELSGDEAAPSWIKKMKRASRSRHPEQKRPVQPAEPSQEPPEKPPARRLPDRAKFQYGNYNRYYGYRNSGLLADPRMGILASCKNELFHRKDVLDIGCNAGHVTLAIAKDFRPNKIVGLDIDKDLIELARMNLRHCIGKMKDSAARFPRAAKLTFGPLIPQHIDGADDVRAPQFPHNVYFAQGNIVLDTDEQVARQRPEYDTILALSVTKWIHLNWGDDGLKRAFKRIYNMLRPGGCFIMEPQAFPSYKRRKNLTERIKNNYDTITLTPRDFRDYLHYEVHFSQYETLGSSENPAKGFIRPIYAFYKPEEQMI